MISLSSIRVNLSYMWVFFCDNDLPLGLCDSNWGINFVHFTPTYQQVAFIIRSNILPKPKQDQFFDFVDLEVMFQLITNKIEFNLCYVLVLNMINGFYMDFMPYGLLLTSLFETNHVQMIWTHAKRVELCCVEDLVQYKCPLLSVDLVL